MSASVDFETGGAVPVPDLDTIHDALEFGLDGAIMSDGSRLSCDSDTFTASQGELPKLMLETGSFVVSEWDGFTSQVAWDIPGQLFVAGEATQPGRVVRRAISDILRAVNMLRGLPIDEDGKFVPYGPKAIELSIKNKLSFLAMRGGPVVRQVSVDPETPNDPIAKAKMLFHVEFLINQPPDEPKRKVTLVSVGMNVFDPQRQSLNWDPYTQTYTLPAPGISDTFAQGGFAKPDTTLVYNGQIIQGRNPPLPRGIPSVDGEDPSKTVVKLRVEPISKTLAAPGTFQLLAIATYADGSVSEVHSGASWGSDNVPKATVSATGLLTAVATGTANITATYNGVSGVCAVTVP